MYRKQMHFCMDDIWNLESTLDFFSIEIYKQQ